MGFSRPGATVPSGAWHSADGDLDGAELGVRRPARGPATRDRRDQAPVVVVVDPSVATVVDVVLLVLEPLLLPPDCWQALMPSL